MAIPGRIERLVEGEEQKTSSKETEVFRGGEFWLIISDRQA